MSAKIDTRDVNRFYVFYTCLAIYGLIFVLSTASAVLGGRSSLTTLIAGIAGIGMVAASVYEMVTGPATAFNVGDVAFWAVVLGTVGIVLLHVPGLV